MGTKSIQRMSELVEDGQSDALWILEPAGFVGNANQADSTEIKPLWYVSLRPAMSILLHDLISGVQNVELNRNVNAQQIYEVIMFLKSHHDWSIFTDDVINSALMWTVKRHLLTTRTTGGMFIKVLDYLHNVAQTQFCPCFWRPNINIFPNCGQPEVAEAVTRNIRGFITRVQKDETVLLKYLGYKTRTELEEERKQRKQHVIYNIANNKGKVNGVQ